MPGCCMLVHPLVRFVAFIGLALSLVSGFTFRVAGAEPVISEFVADNERVLADEDGVFADWIEIHNPGGTAINLAGYFLTDDPLVLTKWAFPPVTLLPGGYLVGFAS